MHSPVLVNTLILISATGCVSNYLTLSHSLDLSHCLTSAFDLGWTVSRVFEAWYTHNRYTEKRVNGFRINQTPLSFSDDHAWA